MAELSRERITQLLKLKPESLKINELRSILSELGIEQPTSASKKDVYVNLFNQWQNDHSNALSLVKSPARELEKGTKRKNPEVASIEPEAKSNKLDENTTPTKKRLRSKEDKEEEEESMEVEKGNSSVVLSPVNYFQKDAVQEIEPVEMDDLVDFYQNDQEEEVESPVVSPPPKKKERPGAIFSEYVSSQEDNSDLILPLVNNNNNTRGRKEKDPSVSPSYNRKKPDEKTHYYSPPRSSNHKEEKQRIAFSELNPNTKYESYLEKRRLSNRDAKNDRLSLGRIPSNPVSVDLKQKREHDHPVRNEEVSDSQTSYCSPLIIISILGIVWLLIFSRLFNAQSGVFCNNDAKNQTDCIPCPPHGRCENGTLTCEPGYIRSGTSCVVDPHTLQLESKLIYELHQNLSRLAGDYECGISETRSLSEEEVTDHLRSTSLSVISNFEEALNLAIETVKEDKTSPIRYEHGRFYSEDPILSLYCEAKLMALRNIGTLALLILVFAFSLYAYCKFNNWMWERGQVKEKVNLVYDLLRNHKDAYLQGREAHPQYIATHVRDTLYKPPVKRKAQRDKIWRKVSSIVEADSRIQSLPVNITGEQETAWEWIAPIHY